MLKNYQTPEVQVRILELLDVVTASVNDGVGLEWKSNWGATLFEE